MKNHINTNTASVAAPKHKTITRVQGPPPMLNFGAPERTIDPWWAGFIAECQKLQEQFGWINATRKRDSNGNPLEWVIEGSETAKLAIRKLFYSAAQKLGYKGGPHGGWQFMLDHMFGDHVQEFTPKPVNMNEVDFLTEYSDGTREFHMGRYKQGGEGHIQRLEEPAVEPTPKKGKKLKPAQSRKLAERKVNRFVKQFGKEALDEINFAAVAKLIENQEQLNACLLTIKSRLKRGEIFDKIKPLLKFKAEYPECIANHHELEPFTPIEHTLTAEQTNVDVIQLIRCNGCGADLSSEPHKPGCRVASQKVLISG